MPEPRHAPNRPHRTRADERSEEIDIRPTKLLADIEQLNGQLAEAQTQADEYLTALQRERAEFLNFKRRTAEERERDLGLAGEDLIRKVLAVADDFDRVEDFDLSGTVAERDRMATAPASHRLLSEPPRAPRSPSCARRGPARFWTGAITSFPTT